MKKLWSLSILVLPVIVALLSTTGCPPVSPTGSGSFTYDGATYPLTNGVLEHYEGSDFDVVLASSGINAARWTGTGYFVWFDLVSPTTIGSPGRYDWGGTDDFILWEGGIAFEYNTATEKGIWIDGDWEVAVSEDYVSISREDAIYTVEFSVTLVDGKILTGRYTGPLPVVYED